MMIDLIILSPADLLIAASLVLILSALSVTQRLNLARNLLVSASRAFVQLLLLGYVLDIVFALRSPLWIMLIALLMLIVAGREIMVRQHRRLVGWWGFGTGTVSMFISSFCVMLITLLLIINVEPWYHPQYLIPLLGMLLGNTMNGIAISLDRLLNDAWTERQLIETRLALGYTASEAIAGLRRNALRAGMIPIINSMAVAGIVSLPGMMTGQILSGSPPLEATKYQILIFFLIAAGTGFGAYGAVTLASRRLFDERQRLRLDRLQQPSG
jgi:putative ABC transport system permease protein